MTMAFLYVYAPLRHRHVRLIQVQLEEDKASAREFLQDQRQAVQAAWLQGHQLNPDVQEDRIPASLLDALHVRLRFVEADLDDLPHRYTAISYAWGAYDKPRKVWLDNGTYMKITESAMEVLIRVATTEPESYFWLDAICINQNDLDEKSRQVSTMYEIYSCATEVVVMTGSPSEDSYVALTFIKQLYTEFCRFEDAKLPITRAAIVNIPSCEYPSVRWTALARFFRRPFFRRIWIVQEIIAARAVCLSCGSIWIPWMDFADFASTIKNTGLYVLVDHSDRADFSDNPDTGYSTGLDGLLTTYFLRIQINSRHEIPPLSYILCRCQIFGSKDPRDRIFALLNMASLASDSRLAPSYDQSTEEVFIRIAGSLLTRDNSMLSLLYSSAIGHERALATLPSWVPDWSIDVAANRSVGHHVDDLARSGAETYCASGLSCQPTNKPHFSGNLSIAVSVRMVDTLQDHYAGRPELRAGPANTRENSHSILKWLLQLAQIVPSETVYPTGGYFFPQALSQTLGAGFHSDKKASELASNPGFLQYFAVHHSACDQRDLYKKHIPELVMKRIEFLQSLFQPDDLGCGKPFANEIIKAAYQSAETYDRNIPKGYRFFMTALGYFGFGPPLLMVGDRVYLIHGTRVPFIVRERNAGGYFLVGECYVHGFMHGEGMTMGVEEDILLY